MQLTGPLFWNKQIPVSKVTFEYLGDEIKSECISAVNSRSHTTNRFTTCMTSSVSEKCLLIHFDS
jgi:hypothetical protein